MKKSSEKSYSGPSSIRYREDLKLFELRFTNKLYNGGKTKSFYGKTVNEVTQKLYDWLAAEGQHYSTTNRSGIPITQSSMLCDGLDYWLYNHKLGAVKPQSFDRIDSVITHNIKPIIHALPICAFNVDVAQRLLRRLKDEGKSRSVLKKVYDILNSCFRYLIVCNVTDFNPMVAVTVPKDSDIVLDEDAAEDSENGVKHFTPEQKAAIIEASKTKTKNGFPVYILGAFVPFMFNTGLREAEMLGLRWSDVDWDAKRIFVRSAAVEVIDRGPDGTRKRKMVVQNHTKTKSSTRYVTLNSTALNALKELYEVTGHQKYVLTSREGTVGGFEIIFFSDFIEDIRFVWSAV